MAGIGVKIENITKRFGHVVAVDRLSLDIHPGKLFTLLGPSGCGKTTLLRTIAGFHMQDEGRIAFDGTPFDHLPPHKRDTGMVFQSYAVFPFMTVFDNVAYGLKARKVPKADLKQRVTSAIELVRLQGFERRRPDQLSGGQQQRVAVARAIAIEPKVLLMDEPLSNLDAKLRVDMRTDIRRLQRKLGITMIYVTHDQEEALAISDKIAVMQAGKIVQIASPWEIYMKPANPYVANFIGITNFFPCRLIRVESDARHARIAFQDQELRVPWMGGSAATEPLKISLRPEALELIPEQQQAPQGYGSFPGTVIDALYLGTALRITAKTGTGDEFQVTVNNPSPEDLSRTGEQIRVQFAINDLLLFPDRTIPAVA